MTSTVTVTIAPCRSHALRGAKLMLSTQLMELAQAMSDDCGGEVAIHVLDCFGKEAAVIGGHDDDDGGDDIELF